MICGYDYDAIGDHRVTADLDGAAAGPDVAVFADVDPVPQLDFSLAGFVQRIVRDVYHRVVADTAQFSTLDPVDLLRPDCRMSGNPESLVQGFGPQH